MEVALIELLPIAARVTLVVAAVAVGLKAFFADSSFTKSKSQR